MILLAENNWVPAVLFGISLFLFGIGLMVSHWQTWRSQRDAEGLDDAERRHYRNRFRRRMQTSAGVALLGLLIGGGDVLIWDFGPGASAMYWIAVLMLTGWVGLLAAGDFLSVKSWSNSAVSRHETARQALQAQVDELRRRAASPPNDS